MSPRPQTPTRTVSQVQSYGDPACLEACGTQRANTSSACWTNCLYKAALGPESYRPDGAVAGMSIDQLKAAWLKPFEDESAGGCRGEPQAAGWFVNELGYEHETAAPSTHVGSARDAPRGCKQGPPGAHEGTEPCEGHLESEAEP